MEYRTGLAAVMASLFMVAGIAHAGEARPAADARPAKEARPKTASPEPAKCTQAPGSRIRLAKPEDCARAAHGAYRSYSKEEIERTGETNMADALRKLDPSFR